MIPRDLPPDLLRVEYDWHRAREERRGRPDENRITGVSSDAMVAYAVGDVTVLPLGSIPMDFADLRACYRCRESAPPHLHARMDQVIAGYLATLDERVRARVAQLEADLARLRSQDPSPRRSEWESVERTWQETRRDHLRVQAAVTEGVEGLTRSFEIGPAPNPPVLQRKFATMDWDERTCADPSDSAERRRVEFETRAYMAALHDGATPPPHSVPCSGCLGAAWRKGKPCKRCCGYGRELPRPVHHLENAA